MPVISPDALRAHVDRGKLDPVYLLLGDDRVRMDALATAVADTVEEELRAFNIDRVYASDKERTAAEVVEAAHLVPMMAPHRVIMVLRAEKWLKPKKSSAGSQDDGALTGESPETAEETGDAPLNPESRQPGKGAMAPLIEYVKEPVPSTVLLFVASEVNKTTPLVKVLYSHAAVVECWGLADDADDRGGEGVRQAMALIRSSGSAAGRQFEPAAAQLLFARSGGDISRLRGDLEHVLLFAEGKRAITRADVEAVVRERESIQDHWAIVNAIERGDAASALRSLALELENGEVPLKILGQLAWLVRDRLAQRRPQNLAAAVQAIFRTDQDLKSSAGDPRVLLERLVLELCGEPRRRGGG